MRVAVLGRLLFITFAAFVWMAVAIVLSAGGQP